MVNPPTRAMVNPSTRTMVNPPTRTMVNPSTRAMVNPSTLATVSRVLGRAMRREAEFARLNGVHTSHELRRAILGTLKAIWSVRSNCWESQLVSLAIGISPLWCRYGGPNGTELKFRIQLTREQA
eukprot:2736161-Pyramimonas_sp.AAC.1